MQFYTTTSYDTFGKFRFKLIYVLDVTKETLEKQDSAILNILVSRMNLELGTGNFVVHPERGALFTPEVEKITILRAVHINKDSREQFEKRTHKRLIDIENPSKETIDALTHLEIPSGVDIQIKM